MYFDNFPSFLYPFKINGKIEYKLIKDISQNVRVRKQILSSVTLYDEYDVRDGETPEHIAERVYGSPLYHWVVMLCNEKYNYIDDYPLTTAQLEKHIDAKYGADKYDPHHYVNAKGYIVDSTQGTSISNYDYEFQLNETKRRIKLISPTLLNTIIKNFKDLI
jgi:hypothetical protein